MKKNTISRHVFKTHSCLSFLFLCSILFNIGCKEEQKDMSMTEEQLIEKATAIHERVITLDTHNDINIKNFTDSINYTQELDNQVNLPKMKKGGLDVSWFIVFTGQGDLDQEGYDNAYKNAISKFNAIQRLTKEYAPDQIELALTAADVRRIDATGKKVAMIGVENGYPLGTDITRVKEFYDLGARYMSLAHTGNNQLSDAHNEEDEGKRTYNGGLSDFGKDVIAEMNKWGIMVDLSHPSIKANTQMIQLSKAPVIASHSSARFLNPETTRNLYDEQLMMLKENGGVVQTVAFKSYLNTEKNNAYSKARQDLLDKIAKTQNFEIKPRKDVREMDEEVRTKYIADFKIVRDLAKSKMDEVAKIAPPVNVSDFVDHIDYLVEKIGIDHVGISSDFDGGGGIDGWNDASETINVTIELVRRGYTEKEISKIWSGNLLRVLEEVEKVAKDIQAKG